MIDPQEFGKQMGAIVREAVGPLLKRIEELESRQLQKGDPGKDGRDGIDGKNGLDGAPGKDGEKGLDGKDGAPGIDGRNGIDGQKGLDGASGRDGKDGATPQIDYDDVVKTIEEIHGRFTATHILDLERRGMDAISRALDKIVVKDGKDGRDGIDGKHGTDGLGFEDVSFDYDGERTVTAKFVRGGSILKEIPWRFPVVIDRGYWKTGFKAQKGDAVTDEGIWWIALKDTAARPSLEAKEDWRIGARKGKDGKGA